MRCLIYFLCIYSTSCRHHVAIESTPYGADVYWKEDKLGKTPMEYTFWWYPGRRISLNVQYFGYRDSVLDIHRSISPLIIADDIIHFRWKQLIGKTTRSTNTAVLVPEHGPAGTWSPEDAQSFQ